MVVEERLPTVSVIIPALNAAEYLDESLAAIKAQTYENLIEIVVASGDPETGAAAGDAWVVENPSGTTPAALNLAITATTGDVVVRCDAQSILPPDYVELAVEILRQTGADVVGGMQVPVGYDDWSRAIAEAMKSPFGAGDARYRIGGEAGPVETVYLGVFRRETLERHGGFDESFERNQDYELNHRVITSGGMVWFDPRLKVSYRPRRSLRELAGQYLSYGRGKRHFARAHPGHLRPRQAAAPLLILALAASAIIGIWEPWILLLPAFYALALGIIGALTAASWWRVALALATMHLSWGLGFLLGPR